MPKKINPIDFTLNQTIIKFVSLYKLLIPEMSC